LILITGGAGFIGSNLVATLAGEEGRPVAVCDRLRSGEKWRNLAKHELVDLIHPDELAGWLRDRAGGLEAVLHMGAVSSTTERDADLIVRTNVRLSLDLWDYCTEQGVPFIYASSAATYGDGTQGFDDDDSPAALARLRPLNAYGWSKHFVDRRIARIVHEGRPTPPRWVGLKFFNVYGPNEYHKGPMRSVVHQAWSSAAQGRPVTLFRSHHPDYDDGGQLRDFVWVEDCVELVRWLLGNPEVNGIYNCGSGTARSFLDLAGAAFRAAGREPDIEWIDTPEHLRARYQYFTQAPMDRLRSIGWNRPATPLEDGVERYVREYLARSDPYR
jgi:ADP-L-glycero-D-manno-heptose 6-epimerase